MTEPHMYHVGHPLTDEQILATVKAGRKCYLPHDPKLTDQRPYIAFAAKPEGAPKQ